jgi:internalin A
VKALTGASFNASEKQTHGIQVQDDTLNINEETIQVHYWDFGGQEIMHATHQFFLTKDSVYIVVLDGRKDENPEYWLKHIATFGGSAPVLVVLNKADDNRAYDVVKQDLNTKYPNIKGYYKISCKTKEGIEVFRQTLEKELYNLDFRKTPFGVDWNHVKDNLRKMPEPHITYQQYYDFCNQYKVFDKSQQDTLLGYLNSLGIVLHFEQLRQYDTQVLNPLWLTQAVYRIINSPKVAQQGGVFDENALYEILNDSFYDQEPIAHDESLVQKLMRWFGQSKPKNPKLSIKYEDQSTLPFIAKVMQQFELSYNLPNSTHYIIPDLLPIEPPTVISYTEYPLHFATEFYFLPPALLPRFIVQANFNVVESAKWRTGVVINAEGVFEAEAVVRIDKENKTLHIHAKGTQKRELLAYIRSVLHGLYDSYEGLRQEGRIKELLFLPDRPDVGISYQEIEGLEAMGEEYFSSGVTRKKYKIKDLFGEIENPDYTLEYSKEKPVKIFISYSHKKKKFRNELVTKLHTLIGLKENYLETWHDGLLEPANDWAKDIDEAIDKAHIVVCLLSDEYFASTYCMYEFQRARESKDSKRIYPILINECPWKDTLFSQIQGYVGTAIEPKPAVKRPAHWQNVYEDIKAMVNKVKAEL